MGKRTSIENEQKPTGKEIRLPADNTIKVFNSNYTDAQSTIDDANDDLKKAAEEAKSKHLNIWAFKICKKLHDDFKAAENPALASEKLAIKLAQLDKLRAYFKLDELANLNGRLFGEGEMGSGKTPPRERDEDGEPDLRPDHLRQPGASATSNPVADIAAKAGATVGDDPLNKVGRGGKLN